MATELTTADHPKAANGLTLPLSKSLGSQELAEHRAMVAVELEVLAKKFDRFGWERDRGSMAHDRMVTDWMDALCDYPLDEIKAACVAEVLDNPKKMPNEGHILRKIKQARKKELAALPKPQEPDQERRTPSHEEKARVAAVVDGYLEKRKMHKPAPIWKPSR